MKRLVLLSLALVASTSSAARVDVQVYLSSVGLGFLLLPKEAIAAIATPVRNPVQTVNAVLGAVDAGAESQGWNLTAMLAAPMVVNLGQLNLTWVASKDSNALGVKLGVMNTSVPMICDGKRQVALQLDSRAGDYAAKLSRLQAQSDTVAVRVEYTCTL